MLIQGLKSRVQFYHASNHDHRYPLPNLWDDSHKKRSLLSLAAATTTNKGSLFKGLSKIGSKIA